MTRWMPRRARAALAVLALVHAAGCSEPAAAPAGGRIHPAYDKATGRLRELAYDSDGNGRIDTWTEMDGTRPVRSRIDRNEDGRIDRWEEYGDGGALVRVGFSRADTGVADAWAFAGPGGRVERIEISSAADQTRIDRWEYYGAAPDGGMPGPGALERAEEDTTGDGRPDRWETYDRGELRTVAFDENGDGIADRRLVYQGARLVQIQSPPDTAGRPMTRREIR